MKFRKRVVKKCSVYTAIIFGGRSVVLSFPVPYTQGSKKIYVTMLCYDA